LKQINNGYAEKYYLTEDGLIYNDETGKYTKPDSSHRFKLQRTDKSYKKIALKPLYKLVYNKQFCIDKITDLDEEQWKEIAHTDQLYYISNKGRVKSLQGYNAIILKATSTKAGYERLDIIEDGQRQSKLVHRLVAAAFLPPPDNIDMQLHHKDGKTNSNAASNLEWLTPAEHREKHKKMEQERNKNGKKN
jgi:hypothetical protein